MRENYLGLDIGSGLIKIAYKDLVYELETPENTIENGEIINLSNLVKVLSSFVLEKKLKGRPTVVSYNGPSVFVKEMTLPAMSEKEVREFLKLEGEDIMPFPKGEGIFDFIQLDKRATKTEILFIALKRSDILPYVKGVNDSGLKLVAIDLPSIALGRELLEGKDSGYQLIIDVGKVTTKIHIYRNGIFNFTRTIKIGGEDYDRIIAASLGISPKEASVERINNNIEPMLFKGINYDFQRELERSLDYYRYRFGNQDDVNFHSVYLIGGNNNIYGLKEILKDLTDIKPEVIQERTVIAKGLTKWRDTK
ncbi:pilus assembly protein PilM [Anaerobranca gottschalkii]|uniref:Type IV pilus assembly protein PilM n=1 Tax=Anaerobranca gottschalkii DSM 13577 TaxID=1120990 RepID=A0A1H9Y508_9FIRM|nr:pilus assembly protein PilM [Anaerobranca gottschalkii]SES63453.1 type IV pilus assembly protein PilM [Anaerobranca gottschalkii DSM 13577]